MLDLLKNIPLIKTLDCQLKGEEFERIMDVLHERYPKGEDPWGLNINKAVKSLKYIYPLYKNYFKVRVFGQENVEDKPYMVVSNHSGQIAIDGMLISSAFILDVFPPRVLRAMVERFFTGIPFVGSWAAEGGSVLGDRQNCLNLLEKGQSILVFPEGVRGVAKSTNHYYQLQDFTKGFYRICATKGVEILPVATIGCEEFFPYVYQAKTLAKLLGLPALPFSANYFPLPSPVDIHIGKPIKIPEGLGQDSSDLEINKQVDEVEKVIKEMIHQGLEKRRPFFATQVGGHGEESHD